MRLTCGRKTLDLSFPVVMGILNVTPDSFSDGGQLYRQNKPDLDLVRQRAAHMQRDGAAILDIGGESTRPGAVAISVQQEMDRIIPVIEIVARETDLVISADTSKPEVMKEAIRAGAGLVNDVHALQKPGALAVVADAVRAGNNIAVCLMHMQGDPQTMQAAPYYNNVLDDVLAFLQQRIQACENAGIAKSQLIIDPGFGFGKTLGHNLELLGALDRLNECTCPILVGLSRKSMIAKITGNTDVNQRLAGSLVLAWACLQQGAKIVRAHDVRETVDMMKIYQALHANRA